MSVQNARYRKAQHVQRSSTIKYYQVYHQVRSNTAGLTTCHQVLANDQHRPFQVAHETCADEGIDSTPQIELY